MKLKGKRIIVKQEEATEKTAGGIFIPERLQKAPNIGTITHIGEDVDQELMGRKIMFHVESSQNLEFGDIKGKLIFPTDIIATLN